jgi:hypothetical protein
VSALVTEGTALAGPDGTAALVCGDPASTEAVSAALMTRGCRVLENGPTLDPGSLEVSGAEVVLLVVLTPQPDGTAVRPMSAGEAAYAVGSRATGLSEVDGGPLPALARFGRRVRGFALSSADPDAAAREGLRLWA